MLEYHSSCYSSLTTTFTCLFSPNCIATWLLSVNIQANPCPFTILVGFISKSYSWILETHLPLVPIQSCCDKTSFTAG
jgi:hypothetical protein